MSTSRDIGTKFNIGDPLVEPAESQIRRIQNRIDDSLCCNNVGGPHPWEPKCNGDLVPWHQRIAMLVGNSGKRPHDGDFDTHRIPGRSYHHTLVGVAMMLSGRLLIT